MDSNTRRDLTSSAYNERHIQCTSAAKKLGARSLRDVSFQQLTLKRKLLDDVSFRRARHVISENERVMDAVPALLIGNSRLFGKILQESHASLRDDFEVSTPALDQIVEIALRHSSCYGARMTGAGFGGCAIAAVKKGRTRDFCAFVSESCLKASGREPGLYICSASQGVCSV